MCTKIGLKQKLNVKNMHSENHTIFVGIFLLCLNIGQVGGKLIVEKIFRVHLPSIHVSHDKENVTIIMTVNLED